MKFIVVVLASLLIAGSSSAQTRRPMARPTPTASPTSVPAAVPAIITTLDTGTISDHTYTNRTLGFELTFPETWQISDGSKVRISPDASVKAPDSLPAITRAQMNRALKNVTVLVTASKPSSAPADTAVIQISVEDLSLNPQIRDAVDYIDAVRSEYSKIQLPAGFNYSETQAEKLASGQFGYLDTSESASKKRIYVTVRGGKAILFTLTYLRDVDLETFRSIMSAGHLRLS